MTQPIQMTPDDARQFFAARDMSKRVEETIVGLMLFIGMAFMLLVLASLVDCSGEPERPLAASQITNHGEYRVHDPDTLKTIFVPGYTARSLKRMHPELVVTDI
jgi:hypothetical protein